MAKLTKAQRARLKKLAAYLEGLPKRYRHFGMASVIEEFSLDAAIEYALRNGGVPSCGSVACAIGHGPAAGILASKSMIGCAHGIRYVDWEAYGTLFNSEMDWGADWCFGAEWANYDDHHFGAAARIRYLLANGTPEGYEEPSSRFVALYAPYRIDAKAPANV